MHIITMTAQPISYSGIRHQLRFTTYNVGIPKYIQRGFSLPHHHILFSGSRSSPFNGIDYFPPYLGTDHRMWSDSNDIQQSVFLIGS